MDGCKRALYSKLRSCTTAGREGWREIGERKGREKERGRKGIGEQVTREHEHGHEEGSTVCRSGTSKELEQPTMVRYKMMVLVTVAVEGGTQTRANTFSHAPFSSSAGLHFLQECLAGQSILVHCTWALHS